MSRAAYFLIFPLRSASAGEDFGSPRQSGGAKGTDRIATLQIGPPSLHSKPKVRFRRQTPASLSSIFVETVRPWLKRTLRFGTASRESALSEGDDLRSAAFRLVEFAPGFDAAGRRQKSTSSLRLRPGWIYPKGPETPHSAGSSRTNRRCALLPVTALPHLNLLSLQHRLPKTSQKPLTRSLTIKSSWKVTQ